jgi:hypothetical protein
MNLNTSESSNVLTFKIMPHTFRKLTFLKEPFSGSVRNYTIYIKDAFSWNLTALV